MSYKLPEGIVPGIVEGHIMELMERDARSLDYTSCVLGRVPDHSFANGEGLNFQVLD